MDTSVKREFEKVGHRVNFIWESSLIGFMSEPVEPAQACVIWLHGLGSNAQDMSQVAQDLCTKAPVRHVFLNAPVRAVTINGGMRMRAWYDIVGMTLLDREDRDGILHSEALINEVINKQLAHGLQHHQIYLAGFSQGGAMALFTGLRAAKPLAGIISLSAYLPLQAECLGRGHHMQAIFIAGGIYDSVVLPAWTQASAHWLQNSGFKNITWHEYPMEHSICMEEMQDVMTWLDNNITGAQV